MPATSEIIRNNNISIRLLADGFSFAFSQGETLQEFHYETDPELSLSANFRAAVKNHQELLPEGRGDLFLIISTERYTALPSSLFSEDDKEALFWASMKKEEDDAIYHQQCKAIGQVFLFALPSYLKGLISELFPSHEIHMLCQAALLAESIGETSPEPALMAHIQGELLTIQCKERGSLTYSKAFLARSNEDRLFYILSAVKRLGLDQTALEMKLLISCKEALPLVSEMQLYIENITTTGPEQSNLLDHRICRQCV